MKSINPLACRANLGHNGLMFHNIQAPKSALLAAFLLLLLLLIPEAARAIQEYPLDVRQITISNDRAGRNSVIDAIQDKDGFLWIAGIHGLYVHDGRQIRPALADYLGNAIIHDIHIDHRNTLWVATTSGLLSYSLSTDTPKWHRVAPTQGGLATNNVYCIHEDKMGTIWIGTTHGGLHWYDEIQDSFTWMDILPPAPANDTAQSRTVFDICEDARGNMWLATNQGVLLLSADRTACTLIPGESETPVSARRIAADGAGNIWANPQGQGLWKISANAAEPRLTEIPEFRGTNIWDLHTDSNGDIWIGAKNGLFRHTAASQTLSRHRLADTDQPHDQPISVASISELGAGLFLIGAWNQGAYFCEPNPASRFIEIIARENGHDTKLLHTTCLYNPQDRRLYVAPNRGGLYRSQPLDASQLIHLNHIEVEQVLHSSRIYALFLDARHGLICSMEDYFIYLAPTGERSRIETPQSTVAGSAENSFRFITQTKDGRIWLAEHHLLCSWIPGEASVSSHEGPKSITALTSTGSTLWLGHARGISRLENGMQEKLVLDHPLTISEYWDSRGSLWAGNSAGLLRLDRGAHSPTAITLSSGTPLSSAQSYWESPEGDIWIHNLDAVYMVRAGSDTALEMAAGAANPSQGIASPPTVLPGNILVYGHSSGLLAVWPSRLNAASTPKAVISDLRVFDQPVAASMRGSLPAHLDLDHRHNYLTFGFSTPGVSLHREPKYVYKLEGVDRNWTKSGTRDYAAYSHLDPGEYTFLVREISGAHPPTALTFTIVPPWWLTPWAKSGYVLALLAIVCGGFTLTVRIQASRIRREMLETLVMQDPLTGIPNRRKFNEILKAEKSRCKRFRCKLALIMIDVDYFKGFNDRFGHPAGDDALCRIARALRNALLRPEDFVARYGGEEFVVVLPNTDRAGAERVAQKIQAAVAEANIAYPGSPLSDRITLSLGISSFTPETDMHIESGLFSADQALYHAKRSGRNRFFYKDMGLNAQLSAVGEKVLHPA